MAEKQKRTANNTIEASSLAWLLDSSNKFNTDLSKEFLQRTRLPADFLKKCVEYQCSNKRSNNKHQRRSLLTSKEAHAILQFGPQTRVRNNLLRLVKKERVAEKHSLNIQRLKEKIKEEQVALNRSRRIIPDMDAEVCFALWRSFLQETDCDGLGICPTCQMIFFKYGGCDMMHCPCCENYFSFQKTKLDMTGLNIGRFKRTLSEYYFRLRLLQTAEELLLYSMDAHKRNKQRPLLNNQDILETTMGERNFGHFSNLACVWEEEEEEDNNNENDESLFERYHPMHSCEEPANESNSLAVRETPENDEWSFSMYTTASHTPSESLSLCDYIFVSDTKDGNGISLSSSVARMDDNDWDEDCSYSILSGCDTVISLDDNDNCYPANTSVERKPVMLLSYCMAAKLGNALSKTTEAPTPVEQTAIEDTDDEPSYDATVYNIDHCEKQKRKQKLDVCKIRNNHFDEEDEDDMFLSMYDAAKSCHGGRLATRFKGNSRTTGSCTGWGRQRRPNWSRKRRKEYKKSITQSW